MTDTKVKTTINSDKLPSTVDESVANIINSANLRIEKLTFKVEDLLLKNEEYAIGLNKLSDELERAKDERKKIYIYQNNRGEIYTYAAGDEVFNQLKADAITEAKATLKKEIEEVDLLKAKIESLQKSKELDEQVAAHKAESKMDELRTFYKNKIHYWEKEFSELKEKYNNVKNKAIESTVAEELEHYRNKATSFLGRLFNFKYSPKFVSA